MAARRQALRCAMNRLIAVIPTAIVLIVAVSMGIGAALLGYPSGQFLSSRSLVLGAPLLRFECSASEVSNKNFPGLISKLVDRAVENSFLRAHRGVLIALP
jgi:hypothetical protein